MKPNILLRIWVAVQTAMLLNLASAGETLAAPSGAPVSVSGQPTIVSIRVNGTEAVVLAQVPAGIKKVTLEGRKRLGAGAWVPRAVARIDGSGGQVTFRVPISDNTELLRVRADASEALPAVFYQGTNAFAGGQGSQGGPWLFEAAPGAASPNDASKAAASRDVVESDIWKIGGDTLYFFNQYRGLQVISLTKPDSPVLQGTLDLPAAGEQMYLRDDNHVVLLARNSCDWSNGNQESAALIVKVENGLPSITGSLPIEGYIQESRMVGTALYVASGAYRQVALPAKPDGTTADQWEWGTRVSAFDLADPANPVSRESLWIAGYGNTIMATDRLLFVATQNTGNWWQSVIHIFDISDPNGTIKEPGKPVQSQGSVADKFKMDVNGDTFTVISENWNGAVATVLETFSLADLTAPKPMGSLKLAQGEQLHATRFDGNRVYVVTFFRKDPLWIVDLSQPAQPQIIGELQIPGWSTYIQPLGDRLVTIGIDTTNGWRVAVQLFNVADPKNPGLLSKVLLGENYSWSEATYDEKAFGVLPEDGLILVPYSGDTTNGYASQVQLIDLGADSLTKRGAIEHDLQPRRATVYSQRILSISGQELLAVDATNRDQPKVMTALELAWAADQVLSQGDYLIEVAKAQWNQADPALRIALADQPGTLLKRVILTNVPVFGATLNGGRLYVAQAQSYLPPIPVLDAGGKTNYVDDTTTPNLVMSVFDVSQLPEVNLVGQTVVRVGSLGWGGYWQALWLNPTNLVWSLGQGGGWWGWGLRLAGPAQGGGMLPVDVAMPWWGGWWGGGHLLGFDVSDASKPALESEVNLATNYWYSFSTAFAVQGKVFLSHQGSEFLEGVLPPGQTPPDQTPKVDPSTGQPIPPPPVGTWVTRQYLDVVDYLDPVTPTVRPSVNIPGQLRGVRSVSDNEALLFTVGYHWDAVTFNTDWTEWLDASVYDGTSANLVTSMALNKSGSHPVLVSGPDVFVGNPSGSADVKSKLEVWTLNDSGKFALVEDPPVELPSPAQNLAQFGDLLAVQETVGVQLFDLSNPAAVVLIGQGGPQGCVGYDLGQADGAVDRGLWLPLSDYGVLKIDAKPASAATTP
jgi:hypothetical protein